MCNLETWQMLSSDIAAQGTWGLELLGVSMLRVPDLCFSCKALGGVG